jgi:O-antigen/teichoic acid export membrane protein
MLLGYEIGWVYRLVLSLGLFADVTNLVLNATLQAQLQSARMVMLGVAQFAVSASIAVVCIVILRTGPIGFFIGGVAASFLGMATMAVLARRLFVPIADFRQIVEPIVRFSLPLLGSALLFFVVRNADRIAVSQLLSVQSLGIYALAWTIANLLFTFVYMPIQTSLDVWRYKLHQAGDSTREVAEIFRIAFLVLAAAALGLDTLGSDAFVFFADPRFAHAVYYVPLLSVAVLLQAGYSILAAAFFVTGKTRIWLYLFAVSAATQIAISLALIPWLGLYGGACSIIVSNLILYVGAAYFGAQLWPVPYRHAPVAILIALVLGLAELRVVLPIRDVAAAVTADLLIMALFCGALYVFRLVEPRDLAAARNAVLVRLTARRRKAAL